ncbi:Rho termination factor, N-terminal domain [Micromonospora rhizosphaerae]|uniref:Rho termination factor, N-terminal domain n=1 Tax=Micromonospora rhizosphaerae TaxID=568872 RepID=A0A1C6STV0_9ACTN|nr:Rho termination factor N-terminal domain-containing protein [Micromonospora rhizosphaerae]SCL32762.1 Rho termination factor, N-terminal domain [Micromonospora rhizosphaerae]
MARDPAQMKTGELRKQAERAGIRNTDQMTKTDMINALGGSTNRNQGGGQRQKDPAPRGVSPTDYKNLPGNQT